MDRPYIICHILSALNGKISGPFMRSEQTTKVRGDFAKIRENYKAQAWLYGTTTTKEFMNFKKPELEPLKEKLPEGDYVAQNGKDLYYVSLDTLGEIAWESGDYQRPGRPMAHVIEVLTEKTPIEYKAYLRNKGVSYIIAGNYSLDCKIAAQKLKLLFGIEKMLICGGGVVDWSFVSQGVTDELSLMLSPVADGKSDTPTIFECMEGLDNAQPVSFTLKQVTKTEGGGVHLVYSVDNAQK